MTEHPEIDPSYRAEIGTRLLAILTNGPAGLPELVIRSEGAYPTEVRGVLQTLQCRGRVKVGPSGSWMLAECNSGLPEASAQASSAPPTVPDQFFPEPHALDFDWRFTTETLDFLHRYMSAFHVRSAAVLGAPTLFKFLSDNGTNARLFDNNAQVVRRLQQAGYHNVFQCDLLRYSPTEGGFDCAVLDPPWYLEHYRGFVDAGRSLLASKGRLLLSMLPRLTRPSATKDRAEVLTLALQRGFELVSVEASVLHYATPSFEAAALHREGIQVPDWRSADLYSFLLTARRTPEIEAPAQREQVAAWDTFRVGRTIVKVKVTGEPSNRRFEFKGVPGVADMRLRSVSRRSPARPYINLWTSRNLVANVTRPELACKALRLIEEGVEARDAVAALSVEGCLGAAEARPLEKLLTLLLNESRS